MLTRTAIIGLLAISIVRIGIQPALADVGGFVYLPAAKSEPPIEISLSSFSWRGPPKDPSQQSLEQRVLGNNRIPPKSGAGILIIATPIATPTPALKALCGKATGVGEVVAKIPLWEERFTDNTLHHQSFKLKNVTVSDCAHAPNALAEVFFLRFTDIEAIPLTEQPVRRPDAGH